MAVTITNANVSVQISGQLASAYQSMTPGAPFAMNWDKSYSNGVVVSTANRWVAYSGSIAQSGSATIDFGAAIDVYGNTVVLTSIRAIAVRCTNANTSDVTLQVGGAASNPIATLTAATNDLVVVRPGGVVLWATDDATGYALVENTSDQLKIANTSAVSVATYVVDVLCTVADDESSSSSTSTSTSSQSASSNSSSSSSSTTSTSSHSSSTDSSSAAESTASSASSNSSSTGQDSSNSSSSSSSSSSSDV